MRSHKLTALMAFSLALGGFAGAAQASATVDLIWIDKTDAACLDVDRRDCPELGTSISSVATSDDIALAVIVTAGPRGLLGAAVSVNYGDSPVLSVIDYQSLKTPPYLTLQLGTTTDQPPYIDNIIATGFPSAQMGIGLPAGQSAYLGTVSFHKVISSFGIIEFSVGTDGPGQTDGVANLDHELISSTTTFNGANLFAGPEPRCGLVIEVNVLRTAGRLVRTGPNESVDVTAKARILKGTAPPGTTLNTTLEIRAFDGKTPIGTNVTTEGAIELEIAKGGSGAKLAVGVPQCTTGFIDFTSTFRGFDSDGGFCEAYQWIRKECK